MRRFAQKVIYTENIVFDIVELDVTEEILKRLQPKKEKSLKEKLSN